MAIRIVVKARAACEFARVDPARFNEMVHAGHFPCAPETSPGSARRFDRDQVVALRIFGDLLSMSVAPDRAGQIACSAYRHFAGQQSVERLVYSCDALGNWIMEEESLIPQMKMPQALRLVLEISELREQVMNGFNWGPTLGRRKDNAAS